MSTSVTVPITTTATGEIDTQLMATNYVNGLNVASPEAAQIRQYLKGVGQKLILEKHSVNFLLETVKILTE